MVMFFYQDDPPFWQSKPSFRRAKEGVFFCENAHEEAYLPFVLSNKAKAYLGFARSGSKR